MITAKYLHSDIKMLNCLIYLEPHFTMENNIHYTMPEWNPTLLSKIYDDNQVNSQVIGPVLCVLTIMNIPSNQLFIKYQQRNRTKHNVLNLIFITTPAVGATHSSP